jgi:hypothetical protein
MDVYMHHVFSFQHPLWHILTQSLCLRLVSFQHTLWHILTQSLSQAGQFPAHFMTYSNTKFVSKAGQFPAPFRHILTQSLCLRLVSFYHPLWHSDTKLQSKEDENSYLGLLWTINISNIWFHIVLFMSWLKHSYVLSNSLKTSLSYKVLQVWHNMYVCIIFIHVEVRVRSASLFVLFLYIYK